MNWTAIAVLAICALYLLRSYHVFGMTQSISETFYQWEKHKWSVLFSIFCLVVGLGAAAQIAFPWAHATKALLSVAAGVMTFLGIATLYKQDGVISAIHYTLATLAICLGFTAIVVEDWQYIGPWAVCWPVLFVLLDWAVKKWWPKFYLYKIEAIAIVIIFGRLTFFHPWPTKPAPLPPSSFIITMATTLPLSPSHCTTHRWESSNGAPGYLPGKTLPNPTGK